MWSDEFYENSECSVASQYIQIIIPPVPWGGLQFAGRGGTGDFLLNKENISQRFKFCALQLIPEVSRVYDKICSRGK